MVLYLLLLCLLTVNFWGIKPFGYFDGDIQLLYLFLYQLLGCVIFRNREKVEYKNKYKYLKWILVGILLSMIPAYCFYGQTLMQSIVAYRAQSYLLTIVTLFYLSPKLDELMKSLVLFSIALLFFEYYLPLNIDQFVIEEIVLQRMKSNTDYAIHVVAGIEYVTIPLLYYCHKIRYTLKIKYLLLIMFLFFVLYKVENRSSLFAVIPLILYSICILKNKYRFILWLFFIFLVLLFFKVEPNRFYELFDETLTQLDNADYNRNKAWAHFIFNSPHWICDILGNGFLSAHATNVMESLMEQGIYNTDTGLIGYWNQFGIIPVAALLMMYIKILNLKEEPYYMKLNAIYAITCSLTTLYYGELVKMLYLVFFYYLFVYNLRYKSCDDVYKMRSL